MRLGITIGLRKGKKKFEVLIGPDVPLQDQLEGFKSAIADPEKTKGFAEFQIWSSSRGVLKRFRVAEAGGINSAGALTVAEQKKAAADKAAADKAAADKAAADKAAADKVAADKASAPAGSSQGKTDK